jgi:uncharacterized protein YoxC
MPETKPKDRKAQKDQKDLLARLTDMSEEAITRLSEAPGADRVLGYANTMRERMDELQRKVRGIDALEKRVSDLEKQVKKLQTAAKPKRTTRAQTAEKKPTTKTSP